MEMVADHANVTTARLVAALRAVTGTVMTQTTPTAAGTVLGAAMGHAGGR